jgi:MoxR-like ATPase
MLGASPRSALFIQRVSRARAAMDGREYVTPDDVKLVAAPVLAHRMILRPEAHMRGTTMESVIAGVISHLRVPGMSKPA